MEPYDALISHLELNSDEYDTFVRSPYVDDEIAGADGVHLVIVRGGTPVTTPGSLPVIVCWVGDEFGGQGPANADLVVGEEELSLVIDAVARTPLAARTLAVHLRAVEDTPVDVGLSLESTAYSMLQAGPEFAAWRSAWNASHAAASSSAEERTVVVDRRDNRLEITLDRPHRHNSITAQVRDELHLALAVGLLDDSIDEILLCGNGPSFCSGGDLREFGSRPDPATAHMTRLARSPARSIDRLRERTSVFIHGATMGGGIELAAFAGRVVAHPDTIIALPEIGLGLIPGAGGTVSMTRRIGRQRTAALALTGTRIGADLALRWGLVDHIEA